jgi:hypothetical protein
MSSNDFQLAVQLQSRIDLDLPNVAVNVQTRFILANSIIQRPHYHISVKYTFTTPILGSAYQTYSKWMYKLTERLGLLALLIQYDVGHVEVCL